MAKRTSRRARKFLTGAVLLLAVLGGLVLAVRQVDILNVEFKRLKAKSPYQYETVRPELAAVDPEQFLTIKTAAGATTARRRITNLIYGAAHRVAVPAFRSDGDSHLVEQLAALPHAEGAWRYHMTPRPSTLSFFYLIGPKNPVPGRAAIYHNGYSGTSIQSANLLDALLEKGVTVIAIDQLGYGENSREANCAPRFEQPCIASLQFDMDKLDNPLIDHVEPVRAAVDLLLAEGMKDIAAIGFSAGAGTVSLAAAVDTRIKKTVAASGTLPYYLREGQEAPIGVADYKPLKQIASMMDLYLLDAAGKGRSYLQMFNRYDRCCFRNVKGLLYAPLLQDRLAELGLGGSFDVKIDETHARHAISDHGVQTILTFLGYE